MAFPSVAAADSKSGTQTSNATSWTLTYPTNIAAGDLIIAFIGRDGTLAGNLTWPSGFVQNAVDGGSSACTLHWAKKKAAGSESGNFSVTSLPSEQGCWRVIRIPAAQWEGTLGTAFTNANTSGAVPSIAATSGSGTAPDPASLDPFNWATEDTLWIAASACDSTATYSGFPTGFTQEDHSTSGGHSASSGGSTGAGFAVAYRKEAISSKDPGAFTIGSEDWAAITIAVRPAASGATGTLGASTAGGYS